MNSPLLPTIGWIGTGIMGNPMCANLIKAGYNCLVYSRTASKAVNLIEQGAIFCDSPKRITETAQIIISMVSFPSDVEKIYFGAEGIFSGNIPGKTVIDMTTNAPSLAIKIAQKAHEMEAKALDAPVSGGDIGAKNASLSIMVGGDHAAFIEQKKLFSILGKNCVYHGPAGSGQHAKMANQIAIAGSMIGMCESLLYAEKSGLNLHHVLQSISGGAAGSWSLNQLAPRILNHDYQPGFIIEHFVKDLRIALEEADKLPLCLPGLALVKQLYTALIAQGHKKQGTQALILALRQLNQSNLANE